MTCCTLHVGHEALALMEDISFLHEWADLLTRCPWATPFQDHQFAASWYAAYGNVALPIIATGRAANGNLVALFAGGQTAHGICAVGGLQAEYPCWLFAPDQAGALDAFDCLVRVIESRFGRTGLLFRYLPPGFPLGEVCTRSRYRQRLTARKLWPTIDEPHKRRCRRLAEEKRQQEQIEPP
jgi:hypothetical protein